MARHVTAHSEYHVGARTISGTPEEKLEQIDAAIQELLDLKLCECADRDGHSNVRFLAVPRRSHGRAMFLAILVMLVLLVWLLGTRTAKAQAMESPPRLRAGAFVDLGYLKDFNSPPNQLFRTRGTTPNDRSSGEGAGFFKGDGLTPGQHLFVVAVIVGVERTR